MKTKQACLKFSDFNPATLQPIADIHPQLGFVFSTVDFFQNATLLNKLKEMSPETTWVGCSGAGEVHTAGVTENTAVITGIHFDKPDSAFKVVSNKIENVESSESVGQALATELSKERLKGIIILSPGIGVNGSTLVKGIKSVVGSQMSVTGGLAGDYAKFLSSYTLSNAGATQDHVVAIGVYGSSLEVLHGCRSGWDPFGKIRKVKKSKNNVMFELDNKPALEIYKEYLGEHAKNLPGSGLLFPFAILDHDKADTGLIRTILSVDEQAGSLTFAGDIDQGKFVRLMHASNTGLVQGSRASALQVSSTSRAESYAMVVSCVGRKLIMGNEANDEIAAIRETLGTNCTLSGFYSFGEISHLSDQVGCELHNQTMTITRLIEN